jgi:hypothetical protein
MAALLTSGFYSSLILYPSYHVPAKRLEKQLTPQNIRTVNTKCVVRNCALQAASHLHILFLLAEVYNILHCIQNVHYFPNSTNNQSTSTVTLQHIMASITSTTELLMVAALPSIQSSIFFTLPAEICSAMYKIAFHEHRRIDASTSAAAPPALTKTCGVIRHEALPIFFSENQFRIRLRNYDNSDAAAWHALTKGTKVMKRPKIMLFLEKVEAGDKDKAEMNLLAWVEECFHQTLRCVR